MLNAPINDERPSDSPDDSASNVVRLPLAESEAAGEDRLPRVALVYVLTVFGLGVASIAFFAPRLETDSLAGFVLLAILAVAAGRTRIAIYGDTAVSIGMVGDFAVAFLYGPAGAAIVSPFAALATDIGGGAWYKRVFNVGSVVVVNVIVALMIRSLLDLNGPGLPVDGWLIPIAVLAIGVYYLLNISTVTLAVSLSTRTRLAQVFREKFEWLIPHYVAFGLLGLALAVAYDGLGYAGLFAFVAPPLMMRFAIKQYIDKTAENVEELNKRNRELQKANRDILHMADQLRETYDGTLEALVSALDARDRETKGHSLRVAKYMMEIAFHMSIAPGTEEWVDMQRGGLLHDIGKIGVSDTILHKPGPLTDDEWVDMRRHPKIGHDMIKEISFLSGAARIVLAHHERYDGKGYPTGLKADEIPLGARIFVLADTFDAMTSDRPYRKALSSEVAREEIIRCSGTQFDPRCVQAFLLAWDRVVEIRSQDWEEETAHHAAAAPRQLAA
ncbi:MAG TPA: HD-GYP domain-containing protein [Dehalococcoidia bacterium]|nr:HD-GYP domain-containing protein [Dehalococcoidia bacterium]